MLRRREKSVKAVHTDRRREKEDTKAALAVDAQDIEELLDLLVGNARVENDQISMSASRIKTSQGRVRDHAKGMREEQRRQMDRVEKTQQGLEQLKKEIARLQEAYEQETACRMRQQEKVLELMEHSKHYTNLMKALQRPVQADAQGRQERQESLRQLVQLLKENNIMLGNMAKALAGQQRQREREYPFCAQDQVALLEQLVTEVSGASQANLARQDAILGEMETVEKCCGQQQESVRILEEIFEQMKR